MCQLRLESLHFIRIGRLFRAKPYKLYKHGKNIISVIEFIKLNSDVLDLIVSSPDYRLRDVISPSREALYLIAYR